MGLCRALKRVICPTASPDAVFRRVRRSGRSKFTEAAVCAGLASVSGTPMSRTVLPDPRLTQSLVHLNHGGMTPNRLAKSGPTTHPLELPETLHPLNDGLCCLLGYFIFCSSLSVVAVLEAEPHIERLSGFQGRLQRPGFCVAGAPPTALDRGGGGMVRRPHM